VLEDCEIGGGIKLLETIEKASVDCVTGGKRAELGRTGKVLEDCEIGGGIKLLETFGKASVDCVTGGKRAELGRTGKSFDSSIFGYKLLEILCCES
jgi:hypothetical protein